MAWAEINCILVVLSKYDRLLAEYKVLDPPCPMFEEYRQHPHLW